VTSLEIEQTDTFFETLFASATHSASHAMQGWTDGQITLRLDGVREAALEDATTDLNIGSELLTMVVLTLDGDWGGQIILTFDDANGRELAALLLGRAPSSEAQWSELEMSALNETGNILACAYVRTISELIGHQLVPSPPMLVQDFGASVLQQAIMAQAMVSDRVLVCKTAFERGGRLLDWNVYFIPDQPLLDLIRNTLASIHA
jgi:chemotaxis protein CheC